MRGNANDRRDCIGTTTYRRVRNGNKSSLFELVASQDVDSDSGLRGIWELFQPRKLNGLVILPTLDYRAVERFKRSWAYGRWPLQGRSWKLEAILHFALGNPILCAFAKSRAGKSDDF